MLVKKVRGHIQQSFQRAPPVPTAPAATTQSHPIDTTPAPQPQVLNCVAFAGVLWSISPRLVAFLLGYAVIGTAVSTCCFGRMLMRLQVCVCLFVRLGSLLITPHPQPPTPTPTQPHLPTTNPPTPTTNPNQPPTPPPQYALLSREGDMRFLLIRLRENSESIAFYSAEGQELAGLAGALRRVVGITLGRIRVMGAYDLFVNFYNYCSIIGG
jgi:hypothetical protein